MHQDGAHQAQHRRNDVLDLDRVAYRQCLTERDLGRRIVLNARDVDRRVVEVRTVGQDVIDGVVNPGALTAEQQLEDDVVGRLVPPAHSLSDAGLALTGPVTE